MRCRDDTYGSTGFRRAPQAAAFNSGDEGAGDGEASEASSNGSDGSSDSLWAKVSGGAAAAGGGDTVFQALQARTRGGS